MKKEDRRRKGEAGRAAVMPRELPQDQQTSENHLARSTNRFNVTKLEV